MKPIAVLTKDIPSTLQWLKREHGVDVISVQSRMAKNSKTGKTYILIIENHEALAWEFSGMIISPFYWYESLEQIVRSRIR